ncbi:MAG: hypothetical protein WC349_04550 [Patescibacteria group bacterium]|jgi:predicted nucleic-acid-binding Zn-ribbon protein
MIANKKCPKCGSENIKQDGSFARGKKEGEAAYHGPSIINYFCWKCEHSWHE